MGGMPNTRRGYDVYEVISAFQKAIRRSEVHEALYWATELYLSGYEHWLWKRLRVIASEDVGIAERGVVSEIKALHDHWKQDYKAGNEHPNETDLYINHATILLALSQKSRLTDWALMHHQSDNVPRLEIPDHALDNHTRKGKAMGRGMPYFIEVASKLIPPHPGPQEAAALEDDYRTCVATGKGPGNAHNPWAPPKGKPDPTGPKVHTLGGS